ncbi:MAG: hypothetical protein FWC43_10285 [Planctomycetaceae bacterium]|nr:hypothetical protein [Planctomycetaceae bacterium]
MKTQSSEPLNAALEYTLAELLDVFFRHNRIDKTDEYGIRKAFKQLGEMFPDGPPPVSAFKAGYLVKFMHHLGTMDYAQSEVRRKFKFIRRVFNWGGQSRYDLETWDKLPAIIPAAFISEMNAIKMDSIHGHENSERKDAPEEHIEAVLKHLPPHIGDMLRVQRLTGMRPGEVCKMRVADIRKKKTTLENTIAITKRGFGFTSCQTIRPRSTSEKKSFFCPLPLKKFWKNIWTAKMLTLPYLHKSQRSDLENRFRRIKSVAILRGMSINTAWTKSPRISYDTPTLRRLQVSLTAT